MEHLEPPALDAKPTVHFCNSGLVILQPALELLNEIIRFLDTSPAIAYYRLADQELLNDVFRSRWQPLPWWCNAFKTARAVHKDIWSDRKVSVIHYIHVSPVTESPELIVSLEKPWNSEPPAFHTVTGWSDQINEDPCGFSQSLNRRLLAEVENTQPQQDAQDWTGVHRRWWSSYFHLMSEMKHTGEEENWRRIDALAMHSGIAEWCD